MEDATVVWNRATNIDYEPVRPGDAALFRAPERCRWGEQVA
jgi:hypothetical protein